jgi:hypothetical protein
LARQLRHGESVGQLALMSQAGVPRAPSCFMRGLAPFSVSGLS